MAEARKLYNPKEGDPDLTRQLLEICSLAAAEAGGFLVPHPEEHSVVVVFGGHQLVVSVTMRDHH